LEKIFVGIDWSDQKHDVCIKSPDGSILKEFCIANNADGFAKFDEKLNEYAKEQTFICIETSCGLLFEHLMSFGYRMCPVNPGALVDYRKKNSMARSKNDKLDARLLSDYVRENLKTIRIHRVNSETIQIIKVLTEDRQRLLNHKVRLQNQLVDTLKIYYPVALDLFSGVDTDVSLNFLLKYPSVEKAQLLTPEDVRTFLKEQHYCKPQRATELWDLLQKKQPRANPAVIQAKEFFITAMIPQLQALIRQIASYDKEIAKYYDQHPDKDTFASLPGAAKVIAPRLLASFGDDRDCFETFNSVQCLAGTAPVTIKSGRQVYVSCRKACNKFFRSTMRDLAFTSLPFSPWANAFYRKQRAKGHSHSQALRALGNKWLKVIHYIWIQRTTYDENYHLAQIQRNHLVASLVH
jgi:transposase